MSRYEAQGLLGNIHGGGVSVLQQALIQPSMFPKVFANVCTIS